MTVPFKVFLEIKDESYQLLKHAEGGMKLVRKGRAEESAKEVEYRIGMINYAGRDTLICQCKGFEKYNNCKHVQCLQRLISAIMEGMEMLQTTVEK